MVSCIVLVLAFKESSKLAAAYGIAVTGTMAITSIVYYVVVTRTWGWAWWKAAPLVLGFLVFDGGFLAANIVKIADGGWVPLAMGLCVFTAMTTWKAGRKRLAQQIATASTSLDEFLGRVDACAAAARAGHRRLHDGEPHRRLARPPAPLSPQPGAARAGRPAHHPQRGRAVRLSEEVHPRRAPRARLLSD